MEQAKEISLSCLSNKFDEQEKVLSYTSDTWLVSILNTGSGEIGDIGHTVLLVEGELEINEEKKRFYGYYHICCRDLIRSSCLHDLLYNPYGKLVVNRPLESIDNDDIIIPEVSHLKAQHIHNSYQVRAEHALFLILKIHEDYHHYLTAEKGFAKHQIYQMSGNKGLFSYFSNAHNCVSWCVEKMRAAYINVHTGLIAYGKLVPQKITSKWMQNSLDTLSRFTNFIDIECWRRQEKNPNSKQEAEFWSLRNQGQVALLCQQYTRAIYYFESLLKKNPVDIDGLHSLALAYVGEKRYRGGFYCLVSLLLEKDKRGDAWYHPGFIMYIQENRGMYRLPKKYEECFIKCLEQQNYTIFLNFILACYFLEQNLLEEAILHLEAGFKLQNEYINIQFFSNYGLACLALWQGNLKKGKIFIERAQEVVNVLGNDKLIMLDTLSANILIIEGKFSEAIEILTVHCQKETTWSFYYRALAVASLKSGDLQQAKQYFIKAVELNGDQETLSWNARVWSLTRKNKKEAHELACLLQECQAVKADEIYGVLMESKSS